MALMDAPAYNPAREKAIKNTIIGLAVGVFLLIVLAFAGYIAGHGWLFTNLTYEHQVDHFMTALEQHDYVKAFGIYNNDPNWQQHPDKYKDYPLKAFTEDWTKYAPTPGHDPIFAHHVDVSKTDGSGNFGTGVIVAVNVNNKKEIFMYVNKRDRTMTWPAPHELTRY